jgi:KUP system potassium uptake protein
LTAVLALVLGFESSSALAAAYGFAVTGTMAVTTVLAGFVARKVWHWRWPMIAAVLMPIIAIDLALFGANATKIPRGAWFPLVIGLVVFVIMSTWRKGRQLVGSRAARDAVPVASFLATCEETLEARVSGTAAYLTAETAYVPATLVRNLKHDKVLHQTVLLVRVVTENIPRVSGPDRIKVSDLGSGFWQIEAHFGLLRRRTFLGNWDGRKSQALSSIQARCLFLLDTPTSNRANSRGWPAGASAFIPASCAWRPGRRSSSAFRRTASLNWAPKSRYE